MPVDLAGASTAAPPTLSHPSTPPRGNALPVSSRRRARPATTHDIRSPSPTPTPVTSPERPRSRSHSAAPAAARGNMVSAMPFLEGDFLSRVEAAAAARAAAASQAASTATGKPSSATPRAGRTRTRVSPVSAMDDAAAGPNPVISSAVKKRRVATSKTLARSSRAQSTTQSSLPPSDVDYIEISGASSPPPMTRRSPIGAASPPTQATARRRPIVTSEEEEEEPPPQSARKAKGRARTVVSDRDGDTALHAAKRKATTPPVAPAPIMVDSDSDHAPLKRVAVDDNGRRKDKGKGRALVQSSDDDWASAAEGPPALVRTSVASPTTAATANGADASADEDVPMPSSDNYGDNDFDYDAVDMNYGGYGDYDDYDDDGDDSRYAGYGNDAPRLRRASTAVPAFETLPSRTQRVRTPTPPPIEVSDSSDDDNDDPIVVGATSASTGTRTAAAGGSCVTREHLAQATGAPAAPQPVKFDDLTLLPDVDERWRTFYLQHWRRGADGRDGDDREHDRDADDGLEFGVAAPAQEARKRTAARRGSGRWRGRGSARGWGRR